MKRGFTILFKVGALSLVLGATGNAAAYYHHRHHHAATPYISTQAPAASMDMSTRGNNPAKRYPARHAPEGAMRNSTLMHSGNNPAKSYATRHAPENAMKDQTLSTNGNNPARRAPATTGSGQ